MYNNPKELVQDVSNILGIDYNIFSTDESGMNVIYKAYEEDKYLANYKYEELSEVFPTYDEAKSWLDSKI
jgi:hypothetical protein